MANTSVPGYFAIRSAVFATVVIFGMGCAAAHAETSATGNGKEQAVATDSKQPSGWGDASAYQGNSYTQKDSPGSGEASAGWHSLPDRELAHAGTPTRIRKTFFASLSGFFYGSDSSGPNRDMDNNISAGGAGG